MGQSNLNFFGEEIETEKNVGGKPRADPIETNGSKTDGFVELAVFQVDYTLKKIGEVEKPIIHVFGRTIENKTEHVQVHGFRPYLYTLESSFNREVAEGIPGVTGWEVTKTYLRRMFLVI
jgi:hypothetical protein